MYAILSGEPDLGDVTDPLRELVAAAFRKDPASRPSAADLVDRLSQVAASATTRVLADAASSPNPPPGSGTGEPTPAPPPARPSWTPVALPARPRRSPRRLALAALAATLVLVTVAATATVSWFALRETSDGATAGGPGPGDSPVTGTTPAGAVTSAAATPSPTVSSVADPCLVGTWSLTSVVRDHPIVGGTVRTRGGGALYYYRPDGTFELDLDQHETGTANGSRYEIIATGTITGNYRTSGDRLLWSNQDSDGDLAVLVDGVERLREPLRAITEEGVYLCTEDSLNTYYPTSGAHEFTRTSLDWTGDGASSLWHAHHPVGAARGRRHPGAPGLGCCTAA
jgi:hypothetical protein